MYVHVCIIYVCSYANQTIMQLISVLFYKVECPALEKTSNMSTLSMYNNSMRNQVIILKCCSDRIHSYEDSVHLL